MIYDRYTDHVQITGGIMNRELAKKRATELVDQMTIEEMASQLKYDAPAIERLGIPSYNWWNEALHGVARCGTATVFPQAIGLAATFDTELLQEIGDCISTEGRAKYNEAIKHNDRGLFKGLTYWSPNVNIFRDPRWGRGHETYGEDPVLTSRMGVAFVKGLQGDGEYMKAAACAKHFAVHSGPEGLRHHFDAKTSLKDLWETYLPGFEACVKEADVEAVMGAYNRTNGEVCCAHSYLMDDVLRGQWDFQGHYVSDCGAIRDFHESHKVTSRPEESVTLALEKGCDMNCGCTYEKILNAYEEGMISKEVLRRSAIRVMTTRFLLGMFDETEYDKIPYEVVDCKEHRLLAEKAAAESMVLLKNDGILPLKKDEIKTIGVIGPNADNRVALWGNYHGTPARLITVLEGIQDYVGEDVRVLYSKGAHLFRNWVEDWESVHDGLSEAKTVAEHSDVVVLCLGLDETLEGEEGDANNVYGSGDKGSLHFPESQRKLLEAVVETGKPFVLCVMAGSAMDLRYASEHASAILQTWYPGARGGKVAAEVLFGEKNPSGKLPITIYKTTEELPDFEDYSMKGRTYRYMENEALYGFGFGLTYGDCHVLEAKIAVTGCAEDAGCGSGAAAAVDYAAASKDGLKLQVTMENRGRRDAEEVLQVYVHVEGTENEVPNHKLAAFKRVGLAAGDKNTVEITVPAAAFSTVNEMGERVFDGTGAKVYVGFGQPVRNGADNIFVEI